jgi:hypothetical protein
VAQDRGRWSAFVNVVLKIRVPENKRISLLSESLLASQEGLCSMESVS